MPNFTIMGGLLEHIRDALDDVVEGRACCLRGLDMATLHIGDPDAEMTLLGYRASMPAITITSSDLQDVARFNERHGQWERLHVCDDCGREEWSEHTEWSCNCVVEPTRNNPEGWR